MEKVSPPKLHTTAPFPWRRPLVVLIIILACYLVASTYLASQDIVYPYSLDAGGEGFLLNQAHEISNGHHLYHDISALPYTPASYPPVFSLLSGAIVNLFGVSYAGGRALSFLCILLAGAMIYLIVHDITAKRTLAAVSALLFLSSLPVLTWAPLFRVDSLGLLFNLLGIFFVLRHHGSKKLYLSIPFFLVALYTKQSFLAAPMASFIFLLLRDRKVALQYAALLFGSGGAIFLIASLVTNGQFFFHVIRYQAHSFSPAKALGVSFFIATIHFLVVGTTLFYLFRHALARDSRWRFFTSKTGFIALCFVASWITALSAGKVGSDLNYFLEPLSISCILFGISAVEFLPKLARKDNGLLIVALLVIAQLALLLPFYSRELSSVPTNADRLAGDRVSAYVRQSDGAVFAEDAGFLVLNGKNVDIEPFVVTQLSGQGDWDQTPFLESLSRREFSLVLLEFNPFNSVSPPHSDRFTVEMLDGIRENYGVVDTAGRTYILKPNSPTGP